MRARAQQAFRRRISLSPRGPGDRGATLPEMMVYIVVLGIFFSISYTVFISLAQSKDVQHETRAQTNEVLTLHTQLTSDVKRAVWLETGSSAGSPSAGNSLLQLDLSAGERVSWVQCSEGVQRNVNGTPTHYFEGAERQGPRLFGITVSSEEAEPIAGLFKFRATLDELDASLSARFSTLETTTLNPTAAHGTTCLVGAWDTSAG